MDRILEAGSSKNQSGNRQGTILVVEDEQLMLRLLKRTFLQQGYEVFTASDGEEAIDLYCARKREIDGVLLDIGLPKISGVNVFLKMKEENPDVRVVIASGYLEPNVKTQMVRAGVKHFFSKPYIFQEIIDAF
jgi:two-component system, cell cycle sensor histidine kinase and response regulator CckA